MDAFIGVGKGWPALALACVALWAYYRTLNWLLRAWFDAIEHERADDDVQKNARW